MRRFAWAEPGRELMQDRVAPVTGRRSPNVEGGLQRLVGLLRVVQLGPCCVSPWPLPSLARPRVLTRTWSGRWLALGRS